MLGLLKEKNKVIGLKQCKKAVLEGKIDTLFVALDADSKMTGPIACSGRESGAAIVEVPTMKELGEACSIDVGASVVGVLKD